MATQTLARKIQNTAYRIVFLQLSGIIILAFLALVLHSTITGFSVLMGGLAYGLMNLLFVWRVFRYSGTAQMTQFMAAFFMGEMFKLVFSAILFLMIVKYLPVSLLSALAGYIGAIISFWVACILLFS